ncbi:MAG: ferrous iron transport protein B [Saprospiraceae bacterium]|nr:ferrous iron transport protein B [Saprospiraceae bacterium]
MENKITKDCVNCPVPKTAHIKKLGVNSENFDYVLALAGNPNTGKSTVFNNLTGLRQHTGNWPGKTVARAEGAFALNDKKYKMVDLPGTYSLLSISADETVSRDFLLFDDPDVTVVVIDSTRLERNLNLTLQILEITEKVVVCLNLTDEALRNGMEINDRYLSKLLGVPVIKASARQGEGLQELLQNIEDVASGKYICKPHRLVYNDKLEKAVGQLVPLITDLLEDIKSPRWLALRLLEGDQSIIDYIRKTNSDENKKAEIISLSNQLRWELGDNFHDDLMKIIFGNAKRIADNCLTVNEVKKPFRFDRDLDRIVTSRIWGFPIMLGLLALVFWLTIIGANYPSSLLASLLVDQGHPFLKGLADNVGFPWWLSGILIDGAYLAMAWVISVMLPPMAIFFPLFTLLEDFGYLPRVAFNMDKLYQVAGAHGKQALTMSMGFGCNAAGVVATRIIDSPRERLIAIITNNFSLCNGRWPTQILIATLFIGVLVPVQYAGLVAGVAVIGIAVLGIFLSLVVSWLLSRTVLQGANSAFSLELPPYRPPRIWQTFVTSFYDRTLIVLWRAVVFAVPAGVVIWLVANIKMADLSLASHFINFADPLALFFGLNGIIILAYIIAIPANEIVIPTVLMLTVLHFGLTGIGSGSGVMFETDSIQATGQVLKAGGWTTLTAINLMLFSLLHNPCSTTIYTIYKETKSIKWTTLATFLPIVMGLIVCFLIAQVWYIVV